MVLSEGKDIPGEWILVHGAGDHNRHTGKIENLKIIATDYTDCHRLKNYVFYPPAAGHVVYMWFIIATHGVTSSHPVSNRYIPSVLTFIQTQTGSGAVVISPVKDKTGIPYEMQRIHFCLQGKQLD